MSVRIGHEVQALLWLTIRGNRASVRFARLDDSLTYRRTRIVGLNLHRGRMMKKGKVGASMHDALRLASVGARGEDGGIGGDDDE